MMVKPSKFNRDGNGTHPANEVDLDPGNAWAAAVSPRPSLLQHHSCNLLPVGACMLFAKPPGDISRFFPDFVPIRKV